MPEVDPESFGDDLDLEEHMELVNAEGGMDGTDEPERSTFGKIKDALMSSDPDPDLEEVEAPYDPEKGGLTRVYRGVQKASGVGGVPAVWDLGVGLLEWWETVDLEALGGDDDGDGEKGAGEIPDPEM